MKKSTLIIAAILLLVPGLVHSIETLDEGEGTAVGTSPAPQAPPLLLAQSLPGMSVHPDPNAVRRLPGMSPTPSRAISLPAPMISDLINYPNPFDSRKPGMEGQTVIAYQLAHDSRVSLEIYDLFGHQVRNWSLDAGSNGGRQGANAVTWDGTNGAGQKVSKGGYIAQLVIESPETTVTVTRKIGVIH